MLTKSQKNFSLIFAVIVIAELACGSVEGLSNLHYITKPAILIALIIFFINQSNGLDLSAKRLTLLGLALSLIGDVLLMFVDISPHFFTGGLLAFLLAHVMYVLVFLKRRNKKKNAIPFILILLVYSAGLFYLLKDGLGAMLIPVTIYMLVILSMATTAFLRKNIVNSLSYILVFVGAICFMASDSLLALNKFHQPLPLADISIMLTYALAQYLIVLGLLKQKD